MSFDVGQAILDGLMLITDKTELLCDGKIYKESRNLSCGEFVLSHIAVVELGLDQEERAKSVLGKIFLSESIITVCPFVHLN